MKPSPFLLLALGSATASCSAAAPPAPKVLLAQNANASKIAQVKVGTLKTANASWWGFDKTDSTAALQAAIDSHVPTLIIDSVGSPWILSKTINLSSNQHIILQDGVVIEAMKGQFHGKSDALFVGKALHDVTIEGKGNAVLQMQKADYDNPALYSHAEWRHGLSFYDSKNITLRNFSVIKTGGDGLYLGASAKGYNDNVVVDHMNFDDNYRQGISVISAQDLSITNTRMTNTGGTAPQAGIDFEPNEPGQRLVDCVLKNCVLSGNKGGGIDVSPGQLDGTSLPISITIANSTIKDNVFGLAASIRPDATSPLRGKVLLENCTFDHQKIMITNPDVQGVHYFINNCILDFRGDKNSLSGAGAPIMLSTSSGVQKTMIGGVYFDHTTVLADRNEVPLGIATRMGGFDYHPLISSEIKGSLFVKTHGKKIPVDLKSFLATTRLQLQQADPTNVFKQKYSNVSINDISKSWHFLPSPATGENVTSAQFDDSSWKIIDGGSRQWWQKQGFASYHGIAWYRKTITVPQLAANQQATLYFDGIDGNAIVYVNGKKLGEHILGKDFSGWDQPFHFDITKAIHSGGNLIAIQVTSKSIDTASGINEPVHLVIGTLR